MVLEISITNSFPEVLLGSDFDVLIFSTSQVPEMYGER